MRNARRTAMRTILPDISQMDSDSMLVHVVDVQSTPIGSVNQRFSLSGKDSEPPLGLTFVARTVHGANLERRCR